MIGNRVRGAQTAAMAAMAAIAAFAMSIGTTGVAHADTTLLNVSYDVTRELYKDIDAAFIANYKKTAGESIEIKQSHGASSAQAMAVSQGLQADVVTMNQSNDIDLLRCPNCRVAMDLHQPVSEIPDRMLWTCVHCGSWYLMDIHPEKPHAVLVYLPDNHYFLGLLDDLPSGSKAEEGR